MKWPDEDEIPTSPGGRIHPDLHHTLGLAMAEVINLRKRLEILEALALSTKTRTRQSDRPGPDMASLAILAKKTIQWAILILAGLISALKELGYLNP